jgi:SAM-dependent methyltransferase
LRLAFEGSTASPTGEQVAPTRHNPGKQPEAGSLPTLWVLQARVVEYERKLLSAASPIAPNMVRPWFGRRVWVGLLLDGARRRGWRTQGIELSDWGVRRARHLGLDVFQGDLEEAGFEPGSFDAVFMIDVLEHLADPVRTLAKVSQVLRPGGVL